MKDSTHIFNKNEYLQYQEINKFMTFKEHILVKTMLKNYIFNNNQLQY